MLMRQFPPAAIALLAILLSLSTTARANTASALAKYVGFSIVAKKTITGWIDQDGSKKGDSFEGCEYGRLIIFDDNTYLTCTAYGYQYDYMPDAILMVKSGKIVMIVGDQAYDMINSPR